MVFTKEVKGPDGKPTVVMVEDSPFRDPKIRLSPVLIEQWDQIAKMIEAHGPANILYIVSDILRAEAADADTQPVYKKLFQALHKKLETLVDEFVQVKLNALVKAIEMGTADTEQFAAD